MSGNAETKRNGALAKKRVPDWPIIKPIFRLDIHRELWHTLAMNPGTTKAEAMKLLNHGELFMNNCPACDAVLLLLVTNKLLRLDDGEMIESLEMPRLTNKICTKLCPLKWNRRNCHYGPDALFSKWHGIMELPNKGAEELEGLSDIAGRIRDLKMKSNIIDLYRLE